MFGDGIRRNGAWLLLAALCVSVSVLTQTLLAGSSDRDREGSSRGRRGGMQGMMGGPATMVASDGFIFIMKGRTLYKVDASTLKVSKKATIEFQRPDGNRSRNNSRRGADDW
ncbi:MAG: hypothetical protein GXP32_07905 [Kiritimatiellaeota bacterium]|nr:hypothetical protein [Kiritimatiellota bacterium]